MAELTQKSEMAAIFMMSFLHIPLTDSGFFVLGFPRGIFFIKK